jgi:hypothetical protein
MALKKSLNSGRNKGGDRSKQENGKGFKKTKPGTT